MFLQIILSFFFFGILDALWLSWAYPRFYQPMLSEVQKEPITVKPFPAFLAYVVIALSIALIVIPASQGNLTNALYYASLTGFLVYSVYNLTNYSLFTAYGITEAISDTIWGTIVYTITTFLVFKTLGRFS